MCAPCQYRRLAPTLDSSKMVNVVDPVGDTEVHRGPALNVQKRGIMTIAELPETVRKAWGNEIAQDFTAWLGEQLGAAGVSSDIQISAAVARRKVNTLVLQQVSNLLLAGDPELKADASGSWTWHVPVDLTFPSHGRVGRVGLIEVDARYGEVRYTEAILGAMQHETERLADELHSQTHDLSKMV